MYKFVENIWKALNSIFQFCYKHLHDYKTCTKTDNMQLLPMYFQQKHQRSSSILKLKEKHEKTLEKIGATCLLALHLSETTHLHIRRKEKTKPLAAEDQINQKRIKFRIQY